MIANLIADPGVVSSIPAPPNAFVEINCEIFDSRRAFVSYKRKYVHKVLVNILV